MDKPGDKAALMETLHRQKAYWEALLQVVSEEDMLLPGAMATIFFIATFPTGVGA